MSNGAIVITGAAGTVGGYALRLAEAAGYYVIANDMPGVPVRVPVRGEVRSGDLRDAAVRERVVAGSRAVIHTAAQLDPGAKHQDQVQNNIEVVQGLFQAATRAGVERFVHTSTALLYRSAEHALNEDELTMSYSRHTSTKQSAEAFILQQRKGPSWTVLRCAPVYGRRGRHFAATLLAIGPIMRLASPVLPRFFGGPRANLVHAEDVARALLCVVDHPEAEGNVYNVADDSDLSMGERLTATFTAYGLRTGGRVSAQALRWLANGLGYPVAYQGADASMLAAWRLVSLRHGLKPALRPRMHSEVLHLMKHDLRLDTSRLRALGWTPRFDDFRAGWGEVLRWYQAEQWVPRY